MKKMAGKISWGLLAVVACLGLVLAWQLKSQIVGGMELTGVVHDECFSPNGDGSKDVMNFSASFAGSEGDSVFAALFIRKGRVWVACRMGSAVFSAAGTAEIAMSWNGKNWRGQTVVDGTYSLSMYYFNIASLYDQMLSSQDPEAMQGMVEERMEVNEGNVLETWYGQVLVDVVAPELTVTAPADNLQTSESSIQTSGTVLGAETLSINLAPCVIDDNQFSTLLELAPGTNTFSYVAEDCAGNSDTESRTIVRLVDTTPPTVSITAPVEGASLTALPVAVAAAFQDADSGINLATLKVLLNGSDVTSLLTVAAGSVSGEIGDESLLNDGANLLRVEVADMLGNVGSASVSFNFEKIPAQDKTYLYGRVLDIAGGSPLSGAVITASGKETLSNDQGQWRLYFGEGGTYKIKITKAGYTEVYRKAQVAKGEEAVVDDAYLTALDTKTTAIGAAGGTHSNTDETVEIVIPAGALSESKNIQVTRLAAGKALPGGLNETANLEYPISFLFCADLQPNGTTFSQAVKLRVKNTWGFAADTEIPFAFWNTDSQEWIPGGMAKVNADQTWMEADISHFSFCDINVAAMAARQAGHPNVEVNPTPYCAECMASSVDAHSGSLQTDVAIPGVKVRGGDTGVSLVYNSSTAYPTTVLRVLNLQRDTLALRPDRTDLKVASTLLGGSSGSGGFAALGNFNFNPPAGYGSGALIFDGVYPSGRTVRTGYQDVKLTFTNYYPGEFGLTANWGGMPSTTTGVLSPEPAYLEDKTEKKVFMVSRADSAFGRGWQLSSLKKLHFEDNRAVVVFGDGSYREYEHGINYADNVNGGVVLSTSHTMHNSASMLRGAVLNPDRVENCARFYFGDYIPDAGTNQSFIIDLGQERSIYRIGLDFSQYWDRLNIWDFIRISTSLDNVDYVQWSQRGVPTLDNPAVTADALDYKIQSPYLATRDERAVRYIKFELGFPSVNTQISGSGIYRVYAIGDEESFRPLDEETWPKLSLDAATGNYILEEFSGSKTVFSSAGVMIAEKERSGRTISYEYNGDNLIKISYPENVYMEFSYGSSGRLEKVRDSSGRETAIAMDGEGNLHEVVYPDSEKREFTYNGRGLLLTDKKGDAVKTYTWDSGHAVLTEVELPNGGKRTLDPWVLKYALNGLPSTPEQPIDFPFEDGSAMESTVTYEDGRVETRVTGSGWDWKYVNDKLMEKTTYAGLGNNRLPVKVEKGDTGWETTNITYNDDQQVSTMSSSILDKQWLPEDNNGNAPLVITATDYNMPYQSTSITYNDQRLVSGVSSTQSQKTFTYDPNGNLTKVEEQSSLGKTTLYEYNGDNDLKKVTYPDLKVTEMTYNAQGLVTEIKNNDLTTTTLERNDPRGEVTAMIDEESRRVELTRDIMGRVTMEKSPEGKEVSYQWGGEGCAACGDGTKLTQITDAAGHLWQFEYDLMGNPLKMTYPDNTFIEQEYDPAGRLTQFTNKRGQEISYTYDGFGKLTAKTTPEGVIAFTYDPRDRIDEITGADFHYKYTYGNWSSTWHSFIVKEQDMNTGNWTEQLTNCYGLPLETFDNFHWHKVHAYSFVNAPSTPVGPTPQSTTYFRRYATSGSKMEIDYTWDAGLRLTKKANSRFHYDLYNNYDPVTGMHEMLQYWCNPGYPGYFPSNQILFERDQSGLITNITDGLAMTVNYDPDLQISSVTHTVPQAFNESYTYDDNGNRLTSLSNSFIYDDLNKLTESTTHEYTYDLDGNMTQERNKVTGETKKYYWDSESKLIKYEHLASDISPVDTTALYKYDIYGRRIQKNVNDTITNFMWEGDNLSLELNSTNQPIRKYFTELNMDDYFAHLEYSEVTNWGAIFDTYTPQGWYGYIKDQVGTVYKVWDLNAKALADVRTYDSFGNLISQTGTTKTPLGFQGKYYDQESGLNYFYHRYYNPALGRFTTEDPIGLKGGLNLQSFVKNNPINFIDPTGYKTDFDSFPKYVPLQDIKISGSSFSWQLLKKMICGDVKLCEKNSFWKNVWENFKQINEAIPGILAPTLSGLGTGGITAKYFESLTLMRWVFSYGFKGATLGGTTFTGVETGIIAGMTSFAHWALISTAFETGIFAGSILRTLLCD